MGERSKGSRGFALVVVLWFSLLLSILAAGFAMSVRTEVEATRTIVALAQERQYAQAAIHRGIFELLNRERVGRWTHDGRPFPFAFDGQDLTVEILDEQGKVDLNQASDELLQAALRAAGANDAEADTLVDRIVDWRDPDDLKRLNGAEAADYAANEAFHRPANRPFRHVAELHHVLGLEPEFYKDLAPLVTVQGFNPGIGLEMAPEALLRALPDVDTVELSAFLEARADRSSADPGEALPQVPSLGRWGTVSLGRAFSIKGGLSASEAPRTHEATTVWLDEQSRSGFFVIGGREPAYR